MRLSRLVILTASFVGAPTLVDAQANVVNIDFEDLVGASYFSLSPVPDYARLTDQYASLGIRFENAAVVNLGAGHAVNGANGISGISPFGTVTYSAIYPQLSFAFFVNGQAATTTFVSIAGDLGGSFTQNPVLSAYDINGVFLAAIRGFDNGGQVYTLRAEGIHSVRWSGVEYTDQEGGGVALDNLHFEQPVSTVPEPGTIVLLVSGLTPIAWLRHRNRRRIPTSN